MTTNGFDFVPKQDDKIIAVIGLPGSGKTTFIDHIVGYAERPPSRLSYINDKIEPTRHPHPFLPSQSLVILEAGSYDEDLCGSLDSVEEWISAKYTKNTVLSGVILVHSVQKNRVPPIDALLLRKLEPFSQSKSFVLTTTFWKRGTKACAREAQLEGEYWPSLIEKGASSLRFDLEDPSSAGKILMHLLSKRSNGTHLKNVFEKVGTSFAKSGTGRRISRQIEDILRREQQCMEKIPAFVDRTPPVIPPTILDELRRLEHQIHELHRKISKLRSSFARRLFARVFG